MDIRQLFQMGVIDAPTYIDLLEKQCDFVVDNRNKLAQQCLQQEEAIMDLKNQVEDLNAEFSYKKNTYLNDLDKMAKSYREMRDAHNRTQRVLDISNYFKTHRKTSDRVTCIERKLSMLRESMTEGEVTLWLCDIMPIKDAERYAKLIDPTMLKKERVLLECRDAEGNLVTN